MARKSAKKSAESSIDASESATQSNVAVLEAEPPASAAIEQAQQSAPVQSRAIEASLPVESAQSAPAAETPKAKADITATQVVRQLDALGNDKFRVALRGPEGISDAKELTRDEVLKRLPYLKMMNVQGNDVLFKPIGQNNIVMIDGLGKDAMNKMHEANKGPAAAIEISPGKHQVWVKVGAEALDAQTQREVARILTEQNGGNLTAANEGHYGRLAGFTNKDKDVTKEDGKQPWVKIQTAKGESLDEGRTAELLAFAKIRVTEINRMLDITRLQAIEIFRETKPKSGELNPDSELGNPVVAYKVAAARLLDRYGEGLEDSKADWVIAKDMAAKGWQKSDIARAIEEASPNIEPRKFDAMKNYANRSAGRAAASLKEQTQEKTKSLDRSVER